MTMARFNIPAKNAKLIPQTTFNIPLTVRVNVQPFVTSDNINPPQSFCCFIFLITGYNTFLNIQGVHERCVKTYKYI